MADKTAQPEKKLPMAAIAASMEAARKIVSAYRAEAPAGFDPLNTAPTVAFRGKAAVEGVTGTFDAILYAVQQTVKSTQNFEEEIVKDVHGYDAAWLMRNEHAMLDVSLKLLGDTHAHAIIPATAVGVVAGSAGAVVSSLGAGVFLTPGSVVVLSAFDIATLNGIYMILSGCEVDLANTKVGDLTLKLRKYANSDQNASQATTPA